MWQVRDRDSKDIVCGILNSPTFWAQLGPARSPDVRFSKRTHAPWYSRPSRRCVSVACTLLTGNAPLSSPLCLQLAAKSAAVLPGECAPAAGRPTSFEMMHYSQVRRDKQHCQPRSRRSVRGAGCRAVVRTMSLLRMLRGCWQPMVMAPTIMLFFIPLPAKANPGCRGRLVLSSSWICIQVCKTKELPASDRDLLFCLPTACFG